MPVIINGSTGIDLPAPLSVAEGGTGLTTVGTNGQLLQSTGSALQFATLPTQVMTLISTKSVSAGSNLEWTNLSGYTAYKLIVSSIATTAIPSSSNILCIQIGTGSTPTWITSGYTDVICAGGADANGPTNLATGSYRTNQSGFQSFNWGYPFYTNGTGVIDITSFSSTYVRIVSVTRGYIYYTGNQWNMAITSGGEVSPGVTPTAIRINSSITTFNATASLYGITT